MIMHDLSGSPEMKLAFSQFLGKCMIWPEVSAKQCQSLLVTFILNSY
jgi:hypothetical protein